jgi:hypothetical protein
MKNEKERRDEIGTEEEVGLIKKGFGLTQWVSKVFVGVSAVV